MESEAAAIQKLIQHQASADNNVRRAAELEFAQFVQHDPTKVCYILIELASNANAAVDLRQAALLHLRRLVPKYWSMAFPSFTGTPIAQDLKQLIRSNLINLIISTDNSKLRNGGSYVIVQIAVADYPDEWPSLLSDLYEHTKDFSNPMAVKGALQVLNDLFDDLVTEEQFWNQGIGSQIIDHISSLLSHDGLDAPTKTNALELYKSVLNYLTSPGAFADSRNKSSVYDHIHKICQLFYQLIQNSIAVTESQKNHNTVQLVECNYRSTIYSILSSLIGTFNKKIPLEFKRYLLLELFKDFNSLQNFYNQINNLSLQVNFIAVDNDLLKEITDFLNEIIGLMLLIQHSLPIASVLDAEQYQSFMDHVIGITCLPIDDSYDNDFNIYITENTGLAGFVTVRDSINEFLSELNTADSNSFFKYIANNISVSSSWEVIESQFYMLESLCQNEDSDLTNTGINVTELFEFILRALSLDRSASTKFGTNEDADASPSPHGVSNSHHLVLGRIILLLPKMYEKFENQLQIDHIAIFRPHQAEYNNKIAAFTFSLSIFLCKQLDNSSESQFVKAAGIIGCINYRNLVEFDQDFVNANNGEIQGTLFQIILDLLDNSEEDTLPVLLEALSVGIDINHEFAGNYKINDANTIIDLVLKISFKDPGNVQLVIESSDCLKTLLENITIENYIICCEKSLPLIIDIMNDAINSSGGQVEYSPNLDLSLELLNIIIESVPSNGTAKVLPDQIFSYIYPIIKKLILSASDDQILQNGGSVFNSLLQNATNSFLSYKDPESGENGLQSLLTIVSKFLSPQLSDSAALNCGTIVTSLINKFQQELGDKFLSQILSATAQRLSIAKEVVTIENLVMLFCNLVLLSPEYMVDFLSNNITLKDADSVDKSGLEIILPIWFQSFEVTRCYEKIKQNALALGKIFSLTDSRIETLIVNGDIIPYEDDKIVTRSMTKARPERYTQISASLKILKLLVGELDFQSQQPNAEDYLPDVDRTHNEDDGDNEDDGWEDLEDIGVPNFETLKSYAESDDEDNNDDSNDEDLKNLLIHFFKECTSKNLGNFSKHYEQLDDHEKKVIAENVFF